MEIIFNDYQTSEKIEADPTIKKEDKLQRNS